MRKLLKTGLITVMIILLAGCSASRKRKSTDAGSMPADATMSAMISSIRSYNITDKGFVIKRGRIELEGTEYDGSYGFNARLNSKGDFYASVRGPLGIELIRLLAVGNDIAAVSRLDRIVYVGKKDAVMQKNGMPEDFIRIIFGDLPETDFQNYRMEGDRVMVVKSAENGFENEINICLDDLKVCRENIGSTTSGHQITIDFNAFTDSGDVKYASEILIKERRRMLQVRLSIEEFASGYDTDIEFNLPSYRRRDL